MGYSTVTNAMVDSLASAFPAPHGPLTRVDSVANLAPNSHVRILFTSADGIDFYASYEELQDTDLTIAIIRQAAQNYNTVRALSVVKALNAYLSATTTDLLADETYSRVVDAIRTINQAQGMAPNIPDAYAMRFEEPKITAFTLTKSGLVVTLNATVQNHAKFVLVDWGDGAVSTPSVGTNGAVTATRTYASTGVKNVKMYAFGDGSVAEKAGSITLT